MNVVDVSLLSLSGAAVAGGMCYSVFNPQSQIWAATLTRLPDCAASFGAVALTFDDGPTEPFTSKILDLLAAHGVKATFFVIGRNVRKFPHLARRIVAEGHTIGNHTFDHHHHGILHFRPYWREQITRTSAVVADITGQEPIFFRPPMGFKTWHQGSVARKLGMPVIGWNLRAFDTRAMSAEAVLASLGPRISAGMILALHDGLEPHRANKSQQVTVDFLPGLLEMLAEKKLSPIALSAVATYEKQKRGLTAQSPLKQGALV